MESDSQETARRTLLKIQRGRMRFQADITVYYGQLCEKHGSTKCPTPLLHYVLVCKFYFQMLLRGHPLNENWMERFMGSMKRAVR